MSRRQITFCTPGIDTYFEEAFKEDVMGACLNELPPQAKEQLINSMHLKRAFFWIGSGFSKNFGYPSWSEVLIAAKKELSLKINLSLSNPLRAAEVLCAYTKSLGNSEEEFNNIVLSCLKKERKKIDDPFWKSIFIDMCTDTIVTTNWDQLLEDMFDNTANVVVRGDKNPQISTTRKNIFKIHGDSGRPNSIVVTQSQYNEFQRENTYLNRKIYTLFSEQTAIFIGYSLSDPNVSFIYDEAFAHIGEAKSASFMVVKKDTKDEELMEARLLFQQKNIYVIKADIGEFLEACQSEIRNMRGSLSAFKLEMGVLEPRIAEMVGAIAGRSSKGKTLGKRFLTKSSGELALKAIQSFFEQSSLYQSYGGSLLSPSSKIDYNEAHQLWQAAVAISNELKLGMPSKLSDLIVEHSTTGPYIWDFNRAHIPFLDLMSVHPKMSSAQYDRRMRHMREILEWSAPKYSVGYCWSTWETFGNYMKFLRDYEISDMVKLVEVDIKNDKTINHDTKRWLRHIKNAPNSNAEINARIDKALVARPALN